MKRVIVLLLCLSVLSTYAQLKQTCVLTGHSNRVNTIAISPDNKYVASGSNDKTIRIWNVLTKQKITALSGFANNIGGVAFSPDGKWLVGSSWDFQVKVWDAKTWKLSYTLPGNTDYVSNVCFSLDGKYLASCNASGQIFIWNTADFQIVKIISADGIDLMSIGFSADSKNIVAGGADNTIRVWSISNWDLIQVLYEHAQSVTALAFSANGKYMASGSKDKFINIWDTKNWSVQRVLHGHNQSVWSLAFSPDSKYLISGGFDKKLILWDLSSWAAIFTYPETNAIESVAFSSNGTFIACSLDTNVEIWDATACNITPSTTTPNQPNQSPVGYLGTEKRLALVIGNGNYVDHKLQNATKDADSISNMLKQLGFEVIQRKDLDNDNMSKNIGEFGQCIVDEKHKGRTVVAIFYFSGHGFQIKGTNYLLPINDKIMLQTQVESKSLKADEIVDVLAIANVGIMILDACRTNPFEKRYADYRGYFPDYDNGLALMQTRSSGLLLEYSTAPGAVAADGIGTNSPFVEEILKNARTEGITVENMFKRVRSGVMKSTRNEQIPWEATSMVGDFYLVPLKK